MNVKNWERRLALEKTGLSSILSNSALISAARFPSGRAGTVDCIPWFDLPEILSDRGCVKGKRARLPPLTPLRSLTYSEPAADLPETRMRKKSGLRPVGGFMACLRKGCNQPSWAALASTGIGQGMCAA